MKLTDRFSRRSLLATIGLGVAAAALAPSVTPVQAAEPVKRLCCNGACPGQGAYERPNVTIYTGTATITSDLTVSGCTIRSADGQELRVSMREHIDDMEFAYAQGRADGYNRGREVEAARAESRLHVVARENWWPAEIQPYHESYGLYTRLPGRLMPEDGD